MSLAQEFLTAVREGNAPKVRDLLRKDRSLAGAKDANAMSAMLLAAYYRRGEVLAALLEAATEVDIFEAAAAGQADRVDVLLRKEPGLANAFAVDGFTPLGLAAFFGHRGVVEVLLASGAAVNEPARNALKVAPLHAAIAAGHEDIARLLIERGAEVNARQEADVTPLHEAAAAGRTDLAKLLLARGADPHAKMRDGKTPLDLAMAGNRTETAHLLRGHAL